MYTAIAYLDRATINYHIKCEGRAASEHIQIGKNSYSQSLDIVFNIYYYIHLQYFGISYHIVSFQVLDVPTLDDKRSVCTRTHNTITHDGEDLCFMPIILYFSV